MVIKFRLKYKYFLFIVIYFYTASAFSTNWLDTNLFNQRHFVENKGQFDRYMSDFNINESILYRVRLGGIDIYFTKSSILYSKETFEIQSEHEEYKPSKNKISDKKEDRIKRSIVFFNTNWLNSSTKEVIGAKKVQSYYTYVINPEKTILANAFNKITYKNVYPNINVEYYIANNGLKYNIIINPGGDVNNLKMLYSNIKQLTKENNGNIQINTHFAELTDHAPISFYQDGSKINSSFKISNNNVVSFTLENVDKNKTIIIDPWVTSASFTSAYNRAFDVNYDFNGNVYIFGGKYPQNLLKYNQRGDLLWIFTDGVTSGYYGDFAVDGKTGTSYLCDAVNGSGARLHKVNSNGILVRSSPNATTSLSEMWRMDFNNCTRQGVVGGGGILGYPIFSQALTLDTNLVINPVTLVPNQLPTFTGSGHDIALLSMDNSNNCYMLVARVPLSPHDTYYDNTIFKLPLPGLIPSTYTVAGGYDFEEISSIYYAGSTPFGQALMNGMNGMAANNDYLYTYDGMTLKQWDAANGNLLRSNTLSATTFAWGGLSVDECNHLYVGVDKKVHLYDVSLNLINTYNMPDRVYDVKLNLGSNLVYACGKGFVTSFEGSVEGTLPPACVPFEVKTYICEDGAGTARAEALGGGGNYTYLWSPSGKTTASVSGLTMGSHTVQVSSKTCTNAIFSDQKIIEIPSAIASFTYNDSVGCSPLCITFQNNSSKLKSCEWIMSNGFTSTQCQLDYCFQNAGTYDVTLNTTDSNGCAATLSKADLITVYSDPQANFDVNPSQTSIINPKIEFINTSTGANSYKWDFGDEVIDSLNINTFHIYSDTGTYCVKLTAQSSVLCVDDTVKCLYIGPDFLFYIPNSFTPNGDGLNDYFNAQTLKINQYILTIFDRWGELIYNSGNLNNSSETLGWDGFVNRVPAPIDTYVYSVSIILDIIGLENKEIIYTGSFQLLR